MGDLDAFDLAKVWLWIADLPKMSPVTLFSVKTELNTFVDLKLNEDGTLGLASPMQPIHFGKSKIVKARWTHITLVYYPHRSTNPNIRTLSDTLTCSS